MDDQQLWNLATVRLNRLLAALPVGTGLMVAGLLSRYRQTKETFAAIIAEIDATSVCCECGGQCCLNGKYRINVLDYLACLVTNLPTSADFSQKPLCPYGTDAGCTMVPGLRPADCVLFICDAIDRKLSLQARLVIMEQEQGLREIIKTASRLTGEQLGTPLLLWAEKSNS